MQANSYGSTQSEDFFQSVGSILSFLKKTVGFDMVLVTRLEGDDIILVDSDQPARHSKKEGSLQLIDQFCTSIVKGEGSCAAVNPYEFSVYAKAKEFLDTDIQAYLAVPIQLADGSMFGTLCALNRTPKDEYVKVYIPLLQTFARALGDLLNGELKTMEQAKLAQHAASDSIMDTITPLYNRRGWDIMTAIEENRAKQYAQPLSIISIDLDNLKKINDTYGHAAGGAYITKAGHAIKETIRPYDIASRTGGDEYNILLVDCDDVNANKVVSAMKLAFQACGVSGSFGVAQLKHSESLAQTMDRADQKMYEDKRAKKAKAAQNVA